MGVGAAIIGAVGALGSAGIGMAGSRKSAKAAKQASKAARQSAAAMERIRDQLITGELFGMESEEFTGRRPEFAPFERQNIAETIASASGEQLEALPDVAAFTQGINAAQTLDDAVRFERLVPGGLDALRAQGQAAAALSAGQLPFDDALEVVRDRAGLANQLGLGGTQFASAVPRDLGMSRLQAIQSGTNLAAQAAQTANVINPISRQATVRDQFLTGPQALEFQQRQNLLEQQSRQTQFNLEASPDPLAQGLLGLEMQRLNLRSSGQLAASQIESANALATAQQQQQSLAGLTGSLQSLVQTYNQPKQEFQSNTPGGYGFNFNFLQ